jgi:putative ABC transport system ATP-binding protein
MPPLIETEGLTRLYPAGEGVVAALQGVDLAIPPGAFVAAMGPSGSGKSTFLNLVGCLDRPTRGTYRLAGEDTGRMTPDRLAELRSRRLGFVFQSFHLLPRVRRARQCRAADGLSRRTAPTAPRPRGGGAAPGRASATACTTGRPALGRAAAARRHRARPGERARPAAGGRADGRARQLDGLEIMALFQGLNRAGVAILMVTHEAEVARFATRTLRFRDGRLVSDTEQVPQDAGQALLDLPSDAPRDRAA